MFNDPFSGIRSRMSRPDFNLDYYTEVQDLSYLENSLPQGTKFQAMNMRISELIQEFGLVAFETLAVEASMTISGYGHRPTHLYF